MTVPAYEPAKSWYQSRGVLGGLVAALAAVLSLWGLEVDQAALTDILLAVGGLAGGGLAVYGRVRAERPIRRAPATLDRLPPE